MVIPNNVTEFSVGEIGNYYGGLMLKVDSGKAYWSITNWNGDEWQEIPDYLYFALAKFDGESK
jgi:hypothetical protein